MNWKRIAYEQGQTRLPKETQTEFFHRVMEMHRAREKAKDTHPYRRDNPDGFRRNR